MPCLAKFLGAWRITLKWDEFMKMYIGLNPFFANPISPMATEKEKETCEYEKIGRGLCWILGIDFSWLLCLTKHLKSEGESRPGHTQRHFYLGIFQWCNLFALNLGLFVKERRLPSLKVKHATMTTGSRAFRFAGFGWCGASTTQGPEVGTGKSKNMT